MRIGRLVQVRAAIESRIKAKTRMKASLLEWQTRVLASFMAQSEAASKAVSKIRLPKPGDEEDDMPEADITNEREAPGANDPAVFVEQGSQVAEARNRPGSFEALMAGFQ